ncbi:MAG: hypothetical protein KatS3mg119_0138 [Rhodothalassiaceae bacterium]|nr:MAG: hypothetical protein KatS3mg119_0138 [Rhodothalassiaceae bacterium]
MTAPVVIFLVLAAAGFALILVTLLRAGRTGRDDGPPPQTYARARLAELEAEAAAGLLAPEDAAAERRVLEDLLSGDAGRTEPVPAPPARTPAPALLAGALLLAAGIWLVLGRPDLLTASPAPARPDASGAASGGEYAALVDRLARVLEEHPGRVDGWKLLARSRLDQGRARDAFRAAQRGLALAPDDPDLLLLRAEALIAGADGRVTPAAELALEKLAAVRPEHPAPRYYRGLALLQAGKPDEALAVWRELAASLKADDPFRGRLTREIARVEMIAAMRAGDPGAAIAGMVERLRARLAEDPDDAEGWAMLARSYEVLGRPADALAALERLGALVSGPARAAVEADIARLKRTAGGAAPDAERKDGS